MPPKTERFELRLDTEIIDRVDSWRREQSDMPSRAEAMRRLVEIGLANETSRQLFLSTKFQIMTAALISGPRERISDAYLYAWDDEVYPAFHEAADWHKPFATSFVVSKEMVLALSRYLDELWINNMKIPSFYELEDHYEVRHGGSDWDRPSLIHALRYMWLNGGFDEAFWKAILKPLEHPSEASFIVQPLDRDSDLYFH